MNRASDVEDKSKALGHKQRISNDVLTSFEDSVDVTEVNTNLANDEYLLNLLSAGKEFGLQHRQVCVRFSVFVWYLTFDMTLMCCYSVH